MLVPWRSHPIGSVSISQSESPWKHHFENTCRVKFEITLFSGLNGVDFKSKDVQSCLSSPAIGLLPADSYPDDLIGCIAWQKIIS